MATHQKRYNQSRGERELIFKDKSQEYAVILAPVGEYRFEVQMLNGEKVKAKLAGNLIKGPNKTFVQKCDNVLIGKDINDTEKDKWYIQHKYSADDWKKLGKQGELKVVKTKEDTNVGGTAIIMEGEAEQETKEVDLDDDFIDNI